jgi:NAD(P)-dependent dehydrogenase (short-subunit alcohol dehydrogenase family)
MSAAWSKVATRVGLAVGAYAAYRATATLNRRYDFKNRGVVITGGSRGLGLILARQLAHEGARLAICARSDEELTVAAQELRSLGPSPVFTYRCDVTRPTELADFLTNARFELGAIDVLINDAGLIQVGPRETQTEQDYEQALAVHFWAPLRAMEHVIPEMARRGEGRIVNISSFGGRIGVPHMAPYCASKFALTGLSQTFRAELLRYGIYVTTVCPGLMRTGSPRHAWFKSRHRAEYAWFSLGASAPGLSMNAPAAARRIIQACRYGRAMLTLSLPAKAGVVLNTLAPELTADLAGLAASMLPTPGGVGATAVEGAASTSALSPSPLTLLNERAAAANNEML